MKKTIYIIIAVALIGGAAFTLINNKKKNAEDTAIVAEKNSSVAVRTATVTTGKLDDVFKANGNFEPIQELTFSAEKSGKVIRVLAKEGDYVTVGQTLAIVRSDVINVNAQTANSSYQNAAADYSRYENAFKTGGVTKQQLDQAKLAMINAKAQLTQSNINVGDTRIKAPISGFINKKYIEQGSILTGMPATELFDIVNVSKLKLKVSVNESQVASLKLGNSVAIAASVFPDKSLTGKITFIASKADETLNFPIEIEIANNPNNEIKAGMYGTATFGTNTAKQADVKTIPRTAFVGSVSSNQVFVVSNNIATLKKIVSGRIFGDKVEILDGLNNGDTVVTSGQINLSDSTKVSIVK
ncbi:efflux RND transporter periplasmic adaptor subunit [Flavobacterium psychrotolerans]|uniref:Efflux transporter periplasmic adaptor subunit n=1 Tax=Flavobacterium psychrotolerans TaxID=2169410 RepID=A0A2U1JPK1_9FLAO|nr:efflux RND transporter periplasmic adaptor subunit [Flavobacterium psychrotolerans]PWA06904.1 efflux transporter periplasmic adaptor subunit [Flavobacterium psychrotolerans]